MFTSIEFYIILAIIAAAIVAFSSRPDNRGPAREHLLAGAIDEQRIPGEPMLEIKCLSDGTVRLTRLGVAAVSEDGAVSLAVKVIGTDISIEERIVPGRGLPLLATQAVFIIDFLAPGRYHISYNSQPTGLFAAFPLHIIPGLETSKLLRR